MKLYKDGKIFSKISIQKILNRYLGQSFKSEQERDLFYYKTMTEYLDVKPSPDKRREKRMEDQREDIDKLFKIAKKRLRSKYTVSVIVYSGESKKENQKPDYIYKFEKDNKITKIPYYIVTYRNFTVRAEKPFPMDIYRRFLPNLDPLIDFSEYEWDQKIEEPFQTILDLHSKAMKILETDKEFKARFGGGVMPYPFDAIYIKHVEAIPTKGKYKPLDTPLRNQEKVSIYHKYIETPVNLEYETLREAIENKNYVENECWLNAITEHYKESLLSKKKKSYYKRNNFKHHK